MDTKYKLIVSLFITLFFFSTDGFSQKIDIVNEDGKDVSFAVLDEVPIFPKCKGDNQNLLKYCFQISIKKHISTHFNLRKARNTGLKGIQKIYVQFKILKTGRVEIMGVRAPHKKLEKEARRVVNKLPKMIPGKQRGKPVNVTYMLPINFAIE